MPKTGELLREIRGRCGMSVKDFAFRVGWSYDTQHRLETDETPMREHHIEALIRAKILLRGSFLHRELKARVSDDWHRKRLPRPTSNPEVLAEVLMAVALAIRSDDGETIQRILKLIQERAA
jgi:transcriptional regulator with XRE-family HTH domain